ncbi:hypothetical protein EAG_02044 [Camponotus floridanus]|uniref:Uncharacterized protein n=1 Tax=Camponotus floridanus TaxID=104421 RepID=E2A0B5_CAMFO|nr:hypothetical protein EAG_02044 [Camponotus floridanus]
MGGGEKGRKGPEGWESKRGRVAEGYNKTDYLNGSRGLFRSLIVKILLVIVRAYHGVYPLCSLDKQEGRKEGRVTAVLAFVFERAESLRQIPEEDPINSLRIRFLAHANSKIVRRHYQIRKDNICRGACNSNRVSPCRCSFN